MEQPINFTAAKSNSLLAMVALSAVHADVIRSDILIIDLSITLDTTKLILESGRHIWQ